jgi:DNA repair exonuclease SbcCD ATPase subunit
MVDNDGTAWLRQANAQLKHNLVCLQGDYDELLHEKNFYRVKVTELSEIVQAKGDETMNQLVAKSIQNAELSTELDRVKQELQVASANFDKLGSQREQNKRILLELSGIVYSLKSVQVDYHQEVRGTDDDSCHSSLMNVKAKVKAIMDDRRLMLDRCLDLEKENKEKDDKIAALEAQFHLLNSMNIAKSGAMGEPPSYTPFPPSAAFYATSVSYCGRPVVEIDMLSVVSSKDEPMEDDLNTETSYMPILRRSGSSVQSPHKKKEDELSCMTEASTKPGSLSSGSAHHRVSSASSGDYEVQSLRAQLAESKDRHQQFKQVCQTAFCKMKTVEQEFAELQAERDDAKHKHESLKTHLRDVINQYKTLNGEHEQTLEELEEAKSHMQKLEQNYKELMDDKQNLEEYGAEILEEDGLADDTERLVKAYLTVRNTMKTLEDKLSCAALEAQEAEKRRASGGRAYRDAVAKCRQLEHEIKIMETRLAQTEKELDLSKKETLKFKEEAKHTRRRLTAYMQGKGIPAPEPMTKRTDTLQLMPELQ